MSLGDLAKAAGAAAGDMAKKFCVETLTEVVAGKFSRKSKIDAEVDRLEDLIARACLLMASGDSDKAMESLFREVTSWEDGDWTDVVEVHDLRLRIVDALEELADAEDEDEPGEED